MIQMMAVTTITNRGTSTVMWILPLPKVNVGNASNVHRVKVESLGQQTRANHHDRRDRHGNRIRYVQLERHVSFACRKIK